MASYKTKDSRSGNQKTKIVDENGKAFVLLDGLSQSARDKQMNKRSVRRPKNLGLIETDPADNMDFRETRQIPNFPSECSLSSTIKEANGADCSNHAIEEYVRKLHSESQRDSTSDEYETGSSTNNSIINVSESQEDSSSDFTTARNTGNESSRAENPEEETNSEETEEVINKCRYSKNAAIRGMLKQKLITLNDLDLNLKDKEEEYPSLVPLPDDPDVLAHPLQAYGRTNDAGINFRLARLGTTSVMTPRQFFINKGLDDDMFNFKPKKSSGTKPKTIVKIPKVNNNRVRTPSKPIVEDDDSSISFNDENDSFRINSKEFPTLR